MSKIDTRILGVIERLTSHKKRCLFGTMDVKMFVALITVFYMLVLAFADNYVFWHHMSENENIIFAIYSVLVLIVIGMTQYGLHRENFLFMIPFFTIQFFFTVIIYIYYSREIYNQVTYANAHRQTAIRLLMLVMYETILIVMHSYSVMVTYRCMYYFYAKIERRVNKSSFSNNLFIGDSEKNPQNCTTPVNKVNQYPQILDTNLHQKCSHRPSIYSTPTLIPASFPSSPSVKSVMKNDQRQVFIDLNPQI